MHALLIAFLFLSSSLFAKPQHFDLKDANNRNQIDFVMEGALERTVGVSHFVSGWIELDPEAVGNGIKGEIETDARTFDTGTEAKNVFIREKILNASEFPLATATFIKVQSISSGRLVEGEALSAKVDTLIKLKGISKNLILPLKLVFYKEGELTRQRLTGNLLKISSSFEMDPLLWSISFPDNIRALSGKMVHLNLFAVASDHMSVGVSAIPEGIKPKEPIEKPKNSTQ